jgi:hypothetical protein
MSNIFKTFGVALVANLAIGLAASALAQEQSEQQRDQDQSTQSEQKQTEQQQSEQQAKQQEEERQRQQQERQQQEGERQQQERQRQEQQRQQQSQQRDQQSRDRDQSSWRDSDDSRGREWPQPDGREYGSDSLRFPSDQQYGSDGQRGDRSQQGGLGVGLRSDGREGVVVSQVHSGSPAEEMGIRPGDRITAVNGRQVQSVAQFISRIRNMNPGQEIELDIRRARGGNEMVRGELESRAEALTGRDRQSGSYTDSYNEPGQRSSWESGEQNRDNQQTRYEEDRGYSQNRSGQTGTNRLDQIERQVDRLSRELDQLRVALQSVRRQSGQPTEWTRERTARYDEYQGTTGRRQSDERYDGRGTTRPAEREREFEREGAGFGRDSNRGEPGDRFDEGPGGEIGSDRQRVGSEDIND